MSFSKKLGSSYDKVKEQAKLKTIQINLGDVQFNLKVRIPLKKEMESITERINNPDKDKVDVIFKRLAEPIKKIVADSGDEFLNAVNSEKQTIIINDDDVILDGSSVRQAATLTAMWEIKVEEYFHLLQSETGEPVNESFEQISEELPDIAVKEILEVIENSIKPDYKTAKKN